MCRHSNIIVWLLLWIPSIVLLGGSKIALSYVEAYQKHVRPRIEVEAIQKYIAEHPVEKPFPMSESWDKLNIQKACGRLGPHAFLLPDNRQVFTLQRFLSNCHQRDARY